jgi:hypothetical protein
VLALVLAFGVSLFGVRRPVVEAGVRQQADDEPKSEESKKKEGKAGKSSKDKSSKKGGKKKRDEGEKDGSRAFPQGPREEEFKQRLGEHFEVRRTDHFFVIYDADEEVVKDFISRLERTYDSVHRFASQLDIELEYPKEKLPVVFCRNFEEYDGKCKEMVGRNVPAEAAGLYWHDPFNFSIFYDMSQAKFIKEHEAHAKQLKEEARNSKDPNERKMKVREAEWYLNKIDAFQQDQNRSVVQHELAHQLLFNFRIHVPGADNPQWFVEGLATQFEPPPGKMGAGLGVTNQRRLHGLREKFKEGVPDVREFVGSPGDGGMLSSDGYAISWGLVNYLVKQKGKGLPKYIKLLKERRIGRQVSPEQAIADFESCFGKVDAAFARKWVEYIKKLPYRKPS